MDMMSVNFLLTNPIMLVNCLNCSTAPISLPEAIRKRHFGLGKAKCFETLFNIPTAIPLFEIYVYTSKMENVEIQISAVY